jgi:hypothetical protein
VDEGALIADGAIAPDEDVIGDGLTEDLDLEDVGDDLLGLAIEVRVDEGDVVVAGDDVAQRGETFLDALDGDAVGEAVAEVLEFLVGRRGRNEEAMSIAGGEASDDACPPDGGLDDGDDVGEFGFEGGKEVCRARRDRGEAVCALGSALLARIGQRLTSIRQLGEDTNVAAVLIAKADGHDEVGRSSDRCEVAGEGKGDTHEADSARRLAMERAKAL